MTGEIDRMADDILNQMAEDEEGWDRSDGDDPDPLRDEDSEEYKPPTLAQTDYVERVETRVARIVSSVEGYLTESDVRELDKARGLQAHLKSYYDPVNHKWHYRLSLDEIERLLGWSPEEVGGV